MVGCSWHSRTAPCSCTLLLAQASRSHRALVTPLVAGVALLCRPLLCPSCVLWMRLRLAHRHRCIYNGFGRFPSEARSHH
eukprot:1684394-Amphidinium_carterae.1